MNRVAVIGAGSWGTAFSLLLSRQGFSPRLWVREKEIYDSIVHRRVNDIFLPDFLIPAQVLPIQDLAEAIEKTEVIFVAVPSRFCRRAFSEMAPYLKPGQVVVSLTKGIEEGTLMRMTEIMTTVFPPEVELAVISGPSFAREVAAGLPTAVVCASRAPEVAGRVQRYLSGLNFRVYTSSDVIGVEIAGAVKNVIAIAAGISDGLGLGHNARASLITRGLFETARLGLTLGAKQETFLGLAGIGDLVLTCTGHLSRNYQIGLQLSQGKNLSEILAGMKMVAEGVSTAISVNQLALREKIEMPICQEVYQVLYEKKDPRSSLVDLMSRTLKAEGLNLPANS